MTVVAVARSWFSVVIAAVSLFAVIASAMIFSSFPAQASIGQRSGTVLTLPPLSTPPLSEAAPRVPTGDFSAVLDPGLREPDEREPDAMGGSSPEELQRWIESAGEDAVVSRSERVTTLRRESGALVDVLSPHPMNVRNDRGEWVASSTSLTSTRDGWSALLHPLKPEFAREASSERAVVLRRDGYELSMSLVGAVASKPSLRTWSDEQGADALLFRDVAPGADLEHLVDDAGVKETVIVREVPVGESRWVWRMSVGALQPELHPDGMVTFSDAKGEIVMHIPTPVVWDSSAESVKAGETDSVRRSV